MIPITNLTNELSVHTIYIYVHITIAITRKQNRALTDYRSLDGLFFHIFRNIFLYDKLRYRTSRIHRIKAQLILMAVESIYYDFLSV